MSGNDNDSEPIVIYKGALYSSTPSYELIVSEKLDQNGLTGVPVIDDELPIQFQLKTIVIDSIKSGTGRDSKTDIFKKLINPLFIDLQIEFDYIQTKDESSVGDVAKSVKNGDENLFVIFISGDTSISEFINGLEEDRSRNRGLFIANIAAGTGNALLSTLQITTVVESVSYLFTNSTVPLSMNEISFANCIANLTIQDKVIKKLSNQIFIAVFSWLFHAALVADSDTPELRKLGLSRFGIAARQNLESVQDHPGVLINDGVRFKETNHSYLVYTTLSNFEKNFKISPRANLDDLYLIEIGNKIQNESLMNVMTQAYKDGAHVDDPDVNYLKVNNSKLKIPPHVDDSKLRFCLDGSIIKLQRLDKSLDIEIDIAKKQIKGWDINLLIKK